MNYKDSDYILQFINACYLKNDLDHIMDVACDFFGNSCALYDMNYNQIITKGEGDPGDRIWMETVHDGGLSEETVTSFMEDNLLSPQHKVLIPLFMPTFFPASPGISRRLGVMFSYEKKASPIWLVIFEHHRTIDEKDVMLSEWLIKLLIPAVALYMNKRSYSLGRIDILLLDLLNESAELSTVEERLKLLGWKLPDQSHTIVVKSEDMSISVPVQDQITNLIRNTARSVIDLVYNGYLVLLVGFPDAGSQADIMSELKDALIKYDLAAGISAPVKDIKKLKSHTLQAINSIRIGQEDSPENRIYYYEDYVVDSLLLTVSGQLDLTEFYHPYIGIIENYDTKNQTDYLETLKKYVSCNGNLKAAAGELWIHRNTMSYRIEKISEILGIDSFDQKLITDLQISFKLYNIVTIRDR